MMRAMITLGVSLSLMACGGETTAPQQESAGTGTFAPASKQKTEIENPPNPCSILTAGAAQAELGVKAIEPLPENAKSGKGFLPWSCAYQSGLSRIALTASWSPIGSEKSAEVVASIYDDATGTDYAVTSGTGTVNLLSKDHSETHLVSWSGLARKGDQKSELFVRATVASADKSEAESEEIAVALTDLYISTARQVAAMGR